MVAMVLATVLHIPLCFLFFLWLELGILGLAIATSIKDFVLFVTVMVYCRNSSQFKQTLQPFDSETFAGWYDYLKVSIPSTVMVCSEWWAFEVYIILAGNIGVSELAALIICNNINIIMLQVPGGFQQASASIIGNSIGANNAPLAQKYFRMTSTFAFTCIFLMVLTLGLARDNIAWLYTED